MLSAPAPALTTNALECAMAAELPNHIPDDVKARFWAKVDVRGPDECWPWTSSATPAGYGRFQFLRRAWSATHISLSIDGRPRINGLLALHSCDNPRCVNPAHLWWGNYVDNAKDMTDRGRCARSVGTENPNAMPITAEVIATKQYICESQKSLRVLAAELGKGVTMIHEIRPGTRWKHVPSPATNTGRN